MILAIALGSTGSYRVDEDGRVYTAHRYHPTQSPLPPGQRPTGKEQQVTGSPACKTYWLPTGQVEELGPGERAALEEAQERLELHWLKVEGREFVLCPECEKPALRDYRILLDGRVPFVCEDRHICVDETEEPLPTGPDPALVVLTDDP